MAKYSLVEVIHGVFRVVLAGCANLGADSQAPVSRQKALRPALLHALCAIALAGCATIPPPAKSFDSWPVRLLLADSLNSCQLHTMHESASWLEREAGQRLFDVELVPSSSAHVNGLPGLGVIGVSPGPRSTPEALDDARVFFAPEDGRIHSCSVVLRECPTTREGVHELLHCGGAEHVSDPRNVMAAEHNEAAMELTAEQVSAILAGEWSRLALKPPTPRAAEVRATSAGGER